MARNAAAEGQRPFSRAEGDLSLEVRGRAVASDRRGARERWLPS
jgi:hypothetical protein